MIDPNMALFQSLSQLISGGINTYKRGSPDPSTYILSTSPPDNTMELYVLKHKLHVCSVPKMYIKDFCHSIIKIAFLQESRPNFFSITETFNGYTIIVTEEDYKKLPSHAHLSNSGDLWHVLTVSVGAMGSSNALVGVSKIAKSVIGPLADHNISVLCMSTYQSDFILVKEKSLEETLKCLGCFFKIFTEDHQRVNQKQVLSTSPQSPITRKIRPIKHAFQTPDIHYHITGLDVNKLPNVVQVLLDVIFYKEETEDFFHFHYSVVSGEISLVLDEEAMKKFPANSLFTRKHDPVWRMIRVGDEPLGFEECGIVAQVVEPLSSSQISTYYLSTFTTEYCMVLDKDIDRVIKLLEKLKIENIENLEKDDSSESDVKSETDQSDGILNENIDVRPGENMTAVDVNDEFSYGMLSQSPQSPMSDDSSIGTSPPTSIHFSDTTATSPIPIPAPSGNPSS